MAENEEDCHVVHLHIVMNSESEITNCQSFFLTVKLPFRKDVLVMMNGNNTHTADFELG